MAEPTVGNGADGKSETTLSSGPQQLILNAQYIKDLSFENPRAPQSFAQPAVQPEVEINFDVKARNLNPDIFEVVLTINATARAQGEVVFVVELAYGCVVTIHNATPETLPILTMTPPGFVSSGNAFCIRIAAPCKKPSWLTTGMVCASTAIARRLRFATKIRLSDCTPVARQ